VKKLKETRQGVVQERALLVEVEIAGDCDRERDHRDRFEELARLADAAGAEVVARSSQKRPGINPATYVGSGKAEELKTVAQLKRADVIIFDNDLTLAQVRNLEEVTCVKVIDRSELILDIFAARARTIEAQLQVELAQLEYTYPRLKKMWTHLSRIEGGMGVRGPGETQLETDRRLVRDRIQELKGRLAEIDARKEREVRSRSEAMTVGIVGYTNAGKSSLLNALTGANAYVEDKLFATLDTRTRVWKMAQCPRVLLSDTVGFIRDLPHHLVASFKATLEEAIHADLLLHVVDVSSGHIQTDVADVEAVLGEIGCQDKPQLLVLNKADLVTNAIDLSLAERAWPGSIPVSALTGEGLDELARQVRERLVGPEREMTVTVAAADGRLQSWIKQHATVLERTAVDGNIVHRLRMPERLVAEIPRKATGPFCVTPDDGGR
jgi:GTP-binding protein HflX